MARRPLLTSIVGAASMIAIITLASRLVGFVRWLVQSWTLHGGSPTAGGYAAANQIPNVLFEVVAGGALAGVVVPLIASPLATKLSKDVNRTASALLTTTLAILIPLAVIVWAAAEPIAHLLPPPAGATPELAADQYALMARLLAIFAWQIPLYGISIVLSGILQAHRAFFWPATAPLLSSLVVIASYLWFGVLAAGNQKDPGALSDLAVSVLGWGTTLGVAALSLPLFFPAHRLGVRWRPTFSFPPGAAKRAGRLATAGIGVLLAQQASVVAILWLSPFGGDAGTLSIFQLAQAVYVLPYAIGVVPIVTAVFPALSGAAAAGESVRAAQLTTRSTRLILAVSLAGVGVLIASAPAIPTLFRVGDEMAFAIYAFAPALPGYALLLHFTRVLYALERTALAGVAGIVGWGGVALASIIGVLLVRGEDGSRTDTLIAFGIAHVIGLSIAAVILSLGVVRAAGREAVAGLARSAAIALIPAALGAGIGHLAATAILGPSVPIALVAAAVGALIPLALVAGAVCLTDRNVLKAVSV
ncbi:hypothetical protein BSZ39_02220 [Bowdeniella nasicola]|uniref:Peptidoglycan lipid II flippase n=1 Tax=Bowdeniella nasicola TaxID=208480 RepID=A0A1Q5Q4U8_9ACTO|nr:lipid II flippase MurJ [Bowdeniella nasicola]OKL54813.1 hypothetical protein BSZ39_02220 [Bowdeniella nasicola]